jgi:hypothetical protein
MQFQMRHLLRSLQRLPMFVQVAEKHGLLGMSLIRFRHTRKEIGTKAENVVS